MTAKRQRLGLVRRYGSGGNMLNPKSAEFWIGEMSGRGVCLLPVAMGAGIAGYFSLHDEPAFWAGPATALAALLAIIIFRSRYAGLIVGTLLTFAALGFALAQIEALTRDTRILGDVRGPMSLTGKVVNAEPLSSGARLTIERPEIRHLAPFETPNRIRLTSRARAAEDIEAGDWIVTTAQLSAPSRPFIPGSFDFRRHAYFDEIGATGFSFGVPKIIETAGRGTQSKFEFSAELDRVRGETARRIMAAVPGESGAIAAALLTGHRRAIPVNAVDAMRDSGLAHLLAISGLHIGLVAGLVFFALRAGCALVPGVALRYPIKKWAAAGAVIAAFLYMLLAGASVPTQRAFIMTAFVMTAVMIDRRAITLRLVAWAAIAVLAWSPHSLLEPGFQMSFGAVTALVAVYEILAPRFRIWFPANSSLLRRVLGYLTGVAVSTLVAGAATAPFALYHFQQTAAYGLFANLAAVPITALWILPTGVVSMAAMPAGWESAPLALMSAGIDLMLSVARTFSELPGAVVTTPQLPPVFIALAATGGLTIAIVRGKARFAGIAPLLAAAWIAASTQSPSVMATADGKLIARVSADSLQFLGPERRRSGFEREILRRASGRPLASPTKPDDNIVETAPDGLAADKPDLRCDSLGCRWREGGVAIGVVWHEGALIEDCWTTDVLIASVPVRRTCPQPTHVIDVFDLWRLGGMSLKVDEKGGVSVRFVDEDSGRRPWQGPTKDRPDADRAAGIDG